MKDEPIYRGRLATLAEHIGNGELISDMGRPEQDFDISVFDFEETRTLQAAVLVWVLAELPFIYPNEWIMNSEGIPVLKSGKGHTIISSAIEFFGIELQEAFQLFVPHQQTMKLKGMTELRFNSDPREVALNIFAFLRKI